jgi:hypothetical protein
MVLNMISLCCLNLYTTHHKDSVKEWLTKNEIGKYIMIQFSGGQPQAGFNASNQYTNINPNRNYQPFLHNK